MLRYAVHSQSEVGWPAEERQAYAHFDCATLDSVCVVYIVSNLHFISAKRTRLLHFTNHHRIQNFAYLCNERLRYTVSFGYLWAE